MGGEWCGGVGMNGGERGFRVEVTLRGEEIGEEEAEEMVERV